MAKLGLDTTAFQRGMAKSQKSLGKFVSSGIAKIGALGTAFAATAGIQRMTQHIQEMENAARLAGETSEDFQRIAFATKKYGIELEKTADILKDVKDKVGDFLATGAGPMADFFENIAPKVGVTADQFRNLSGKEALQLYVSSLEKANVSSNEMTFYMEAIASDAAALIPLLSNNSKELDALADKADKLGAVIDSRTSKSIKQMNDSIEQTQGVATAMAAKTFVWGQGVAESLFIIAHAATSSKVAVSDLVETTGDLIEKYDPLKDKALQASKAKFALAMATDHSTQFLYDEIEAVETLGDRLRKEEKVERDIANRKFIRTKKLQELILRAKGKHDEADALKKQIELTEEAVRLAKEYGITLKQAADVVKGIEANKKKEESKTNGRARDQSSGFSEAEIAAAKHNLSLKDRKQSFRERERASGLFNTTLGRDSRRLDAMVDRGSAKPKAQDPAEIQKQATDYLEQIAKELTTTTR